MASCIQPALARHSPNRSPKDGCVPGWRRKNAWQCLFSHGRLESSLGASRYRLPYSVGRINEPSGAAQGCRRGPALGGGGCRNF
eukprot:5606474-Prymnesium_polylepis.6